MMSGAFRLCRMSCLCCPVSLLLGCCALCVLCCCRLSCCFKICTQRILHYIQNTGINQDSSRKYKLVSLERKQKIIILENKTVNTALISAKKIILFLSVCRSVCCWECSRLNSSGRINPEQIQNKRSITRINGKYKTAGIIIYNTGIMPAVCRCGISSGKIACCAACTDL